MIRTVSQDGGYLRSDFSLWEKKKKKKRRIDNRDNRNGRDYYAHLKNRWITESQRAES